MKLLFVETTDVDLKSEVLKFDESQLLQNQLVHELFSPS